MKRLDKNIEALKIAIEIANSPRTLNQKEVETLQAYSGFGGIDIAHLNNEDAETLKNVVETISQITNEPADTLMRSLKTSTLTAFYTPTIIPQAVSIAMQLAGFPAKAHPRTVLWNWQLPPAFRTVLPTSCNHRLRD